MQITTTFRDMPPRPGLEAAVERWTARLERINDRILGCEVLIEQEHDRGRDGEQPVVVRVSLSVPGSSIVVANRSRVDAYVAVADTFRAARRRLLAHAHRKGDE